MTTPTIVLVPGFWLGSWAWERVEDRLAELDHPSISLTLPGLDPADPDRASRTPEEQTTALIGASSAPAILVAHSGANIPATMAMDRRPDLFQRVIWVDSGPVADGFIFDPESTQDLKEFPLPDFDVLGEGASLEGIDEKDLERFRERSVPEPGALLTTPISLSNEERYAIPTTLVCCSLSSEQIKEFADTGHPMAADLNKYTDVTAVDLPTGHWPMWSRPKELADAIAQAIA